MAKIAQNVSVEDEVYNIAQKQMTKENRTFSNLVETALIEYLQRRKTPGLQFYLDQKNKKDSLEKEYLRQA